MSTITAPVAAPVETVTPIKPSEAMRLGRVLYPIRITGSLGGYVDTPGVYGPFGVCALGAAAVGLGWDPCWANERMANVILSRAFGRMRRTCPVPDCDDDFNDRRRAVKDVVWHLNDDHEWSTDQIATWLEGLGL